MRTRATLAVRLVTRVTRVDIPKMLKDGHTLITVFTICIVKAKALIYPLTTQ